MAVPVVVVVVVVVVAAAAVAAVVVVVVVVVVAVVVVVGVVVGVEERSYSRHPPRQFRYVVVWHLFCCRVQGHPSSSVFVARRPDLNCPKHEDHLCFHGCGGVVGVLASSTYRVRSRRFRSPNLTDACSSLVLLVAKTIACVPVVSVNGVDRGDNGSNPPCADQQKSKKMPHFSPPNKHPNNPPSTTSTIHNRQTDRRTDGQTDRQQTLRQVRIKI